MESVKEEVRGLQNRVFIISSIRIWLQKVQHGIDVPGTTIHVFYATKMGKKYEKRYCTYFKNPDIRRHNMQHEELFCCHSAEWVEEVRKAVEGDR